MKNLSLVLLAMLYVMTSDAQTVAVTENGDSVLLLPNGTWDYLENTSKEAVADRPVKEEVEESSIPTNKESFERSLLSSKFVNLANEQFKIWYNEKKWKKIVPGVLNEEAEYAWQMRSNPGYAFVLLDDKEVDIKTMKKNALDNALSIASDTKIIEEDFREVNGTKILSTQMEGTAQELSVRYYNYYLSNKNGSIQFTCFTGKSIFEDLEGEFLEMLNGLEVVN